MIHHAAPDYHLVKYSVRDIHNDGEVDQAKHEFLELFREKIVETTKRVTEFEENILMYEQGIKEIPPDKLSIRVGRGIRSAGMITLYAIGILTVIPAAIVIGMGLNAKKWRDVKVLQIGHKFITLDSQAMIALKDKLDDLKDEIPSIKNPLRLNAVIKDGQKQKIVLSAKTILKHFPDAQELVENAKDLSVRLEELKKL